MKLKLILILIFIISTMKLSATSLKSIVNSVLDTNPVVTERLRNYRATEADIGIAEAGYYPTVDLQSSIGRKTTGRISDDVVTGVHNIYQHSLILKQNLFNGYSTHHRVNYQKMRRLAAAYSYIEKANDVALQAVTVYINLQKDNKLLKNSQQNIERNQMIYDKVLKAYEAGFTTLSEVSKINSSLALAKANMSVQQNRLINSYNSFRKVVGRMIIVEELNQLNFNLKLPKSKEKAEMYALEYNPSVLVGKYNIQGAESLYRESRKMLYPKVDFEMSQNYNNNYSSTIGREDRSQALIVLSYNLFNGGADEAVRRNKLSKLSQEVSVLNNTRREVIENVNLSWSAYELSKTQIPFLTDYKDLSQQTLNLYAKEYSLGERSMLDLISAENDLKKANDELISSQYNLVLAQYRIMDSMGLTVASILGNEKSYYRRVGINKGKRVKYKKTKTKITPKYHKKDTLPVTQDNDQDRIPDSQDVSPNSKVNFDIAPSGTNIKLREAKSINWSF